MKSEQNITLSYQPINIVGLINHEVSRNIILIIDSQLKMLNLTQNIISKVKLIAVEILENICKHQHKEVVEYPEFSIKKNNNQLVLTASNQINPSKHAELSEKLSNLKKFNKEEINKMYINQLANGKLSATGNAGLGLITIAKRSNNQYKYKFTSAGNITIFTLEITLDYADN